MDAIVLEYDKASSEILLKVTLARLASKKTADIWVSTKTGKQLVDNGAEVNWKLTANVKGRAGFDLTSWPRATLAAKSKKAPKFQDDGIVSIVDEVAPLQDLIEAKKEKQLKFQPDAE